MKATEIPAFGSATRSMSKNKETPWSSPLSRTSSRAAKSELDICDDAPKVVSGKGGREFHFSIYKWPNKGVPVIIWGSSRLSSMAKAEETTTPSDLQSNSVEKAGEGEEESGLKEEKKTCGVQTKEEKIDSMSEQAFSGVSKANEANVKPLHSFLDDKDNTQGKSKAKNMRSSAGGDSRSKKKPQGTRSSLDSPTIPDKTSFASSSSTATPQVVGKDGVKGKVMDFVKIFSQGASVGESLGQSSKWRAKEEIHRAADINHESANVNAKETVNNIPYQQQKKPTPDIRAMVLKSAKSRSSSYILLCFVILCL